MRGEILKILEGEVFATWAIAAQIKKITPIVRAELKRMERDGLVERHSYSSVNNIVWKLPGSSYKF